jgi:RIO kinase 1
VKSKEDWKVYGNVFSQRSLQLLFKLSSQGYFEELESSISVGKEANIFTATTTDQKRIVAKIYRLENVNFKQMYDYLASDPRYTNTTRNSRIIVFTWTQREYRNLLKAREVIKVPSPIAFKDNIILMEFIGDEHPAPELKIAPPKDPKKFFNKTIDNMRKLFKAGLIHGDLSSFNILNHHEEPIFIDFSQATTTDANNAQELLRRDIRNICDYFKKKLQVKEADEEIVYAKIVK